jgi:hypothetical protein
MEAILTSYRILFNIEFQLAGYPDDLRSLIKVVPDQETRERYKRYSILARSQKNATTILIEVEPQGVVENVPIFMLDQNEVFRFQVKFPNAGFFRRTHLAFYDLTDRVLFASNEANHKVGPNLLLSVPVITYDAGDDYKRGYIVESSGDFYKALKESSAGAPHGVSETDYWIEIVDGETLISQADLVDRATLTYPVDLDTVMIVEIRHKNSVTPDYRLLDGSLKCREVSYKIKLHS